MTLSINHLDDVSGVYALVCGVTQMIYVGSSGRIRARIAGHRRTLVKGRHGNYKLQRDFVRHGEGSFTAVILELCEYGDLTNREQWWIDKLDAVSRGYNILSKAVVPSDELLLKLRKQRRPLSLAHRETISNSLMGHRRSSASIEGTRRGLTGRKQTPEHVAARIAANRMMRAGHV